MASAGDRFATSEDIKKETVLFNDADTFIKTPAKRKRDGGAMEGDNPQLMTDLKSMRYSRLLPDDKEELENLIDYGMKPGLLTTVVAGIEGNLVLLGEGLEEVAILTESRFESNESDISMISGTIQNVKSGLGATPTELNSAFEAPTLWGTVSFTSDELLRVSNQVKTSVDAFGPFRVSTESNLEDFKIRADHSTAKVIAVMMNSTAILAKENGKVKAAVAKMEERLRSRAFGGATGDDSVENLMNRMGMGGRTPFGMETPASRASTMTPPSGERNEGN